MSKIFRDETPSWPGRFGQLGAVGGVRGEHWMKPGSTELVTSPSLFRRVEQGSPGRKRPGNLVPVEVQGPASWKLNCRKKQLGAGLPENELLIRVEAEGAEAARWICPPGSQGQKECHQGPILYRPIGPRGHLGKDGCKA